MEERGVERFADGGRVSLSTLARAFECSRESVKKRLLAGAVDPAGEIKNNPVYPLVPSIRAMRQVELEDRGDLSEEQARRLPPLERRAWFDSEKIRQGMLRDNGKLVAVDDVRAQMAILVKILAAACDSIPDELEREARLPPAQIALIEAKLDAIRDEIAGHLESSA